MKHADRGTGLLIPRYYLRWIPYLGVDLAWIPVGFRQVAYFRGMGFEAGDEFQCSHRELALWSGMSERNLYRKINDPRLGWFIERVEQEAVWSIGNDGAPHREAMSWKVMMSMPLTPADQATLQTFFRSAIAAGAGERGALQAAYETPLNDLLPRTLEMDPPEMASLPRGVEQVVEAALGHNALRPEMKKLVAALSMKIGGYGDSLEITHYFIRHHLPRTAIGPGRGWLVQVLRALSREQGFGLDMVVKGGHASLASMLGVNVGTVRRWMGETKGRLQDEIGLEAFVSYQGVVKYANGTVDLVARVARDEPVLPEHERAADIQVPVVLANSMKPDPAGETPGAQAVRIEVAPDAQSDSIRGDPDAYSGSLRRGSGAQVVRIGPERDPQAVMIGATSQARSLSGLKGVGGGLDSESVMRKSNSPFNYDATGNGAQPVGNGDGRGWDLGELLERASVHPVARRRLQGASPIAWVSWLLYWASPLGKRLVEPTGNAISRLAEAPQAPMAGSFERLAALGPDGLEELIVPRVRNRFGDHPQNQDWTDVMAGGPEERLHRLVDLLGFDLAGWRDDDENDEGSEDPWKEDDGGDGRPVN